MYSAYKLNKHDDNIQPWCTTFPILNQSIVSCFVLTVSSWPAYRFLRMQVRWFSISISLRIFQFIVIKTVKGFSIVNEAEVDVFLEISCFFCVPMDVGNLISGSSSLKSGGQKWGYQSIDNTYLRGSWRSLDEVTRVSTLWYINSFFLSNSTHGDLPKFIYTPRGGGWVQETTTVTKAPVPLKSRLRKEVHSGSLHRLP